MKAITKRIIENTNGVVGRAVIDRRRKTESAIMVELRTLSKLFNSPLTPAMLYNYYISISQVPMWDLTDDFKVGKQLGYTARSIADNRRKLEKAGWIRFEVHKHKNIRYGTWYIGEEVVASRLASGQTTDLEELVKIGVILEDEYIAAKDVIDEETK